MPTKPKACASVWQAVAKDEAEAETMRLRADLLIALRDRVDAWKAMQAEAPSASASRSRASTTC